MKSIVWIFVIFCSSVLSQDVQIPDDLLETTTEAKNFTNCETDENSEDCKENTTLLPLDSDDDIPPECLTDGRRFPPVEPNVPPCDVIPPIEIRIPDPCPPGYILSTNVCIPIHSGPPTLPNPSPIPVPPTVNVTFDPAEREELIQCPNGQVQDGNVCVQVNVGVCAEGYTWRNGHCVIKIKTCPPNFELDEYNRCVQLPLCPQNHVYQNGRCVQPEPECPTGWKWNGIQCAVSIIRCPKGTVLQGTECIEEKISCPHGYEQRGDECYKPVICPPGYELKASGFCSKIIEKCPPGSVLINGECRRSFESCPPDTFLFNGQCYSQYNRTVPPSPPTICPNGYYRINNQCQPHVVLTTPRSSTKFTCPDGYKLHRGNCYKCHTQDPVPPHKIPPTISCPPGFTALNNLCYRCPPNYKLCEEKCIRTTANCGSQKPQDGGNNINVNVNVNMPKGHSGSGPGYNIINNIEPIVNNITNINNVTHPIVLNNVNENNINIYSDVQCADGSIKTVIVKNNETINGCVDVDGNEPSKVEGGESEESKNEGSKNCCDIVTPRKCKKRNENQWICSHRSYNYCGSFCISNRMYLKPATTTFSNQVLTIAPMQPYGDARTCFGRGCPRFDCSGCADGSHNCSAECYTYPCNHAGCHYLSEEDFCGTVGGKVCENN